MSTNTPLEKQLHQLRLIVLNVDATLKNIIKNLDSTETDDSSIQTLLAKSTKNLPVKDIKAVEKKVTAKPSTPKPSVPYQIKTFGMHDFTMYTIEQIDDAIEYLSREDAVINGPLRPVLRALLKAQDALNNPEPSSDGDSTQESV